MMYVVVCVDDGLGNDLSFLMPRTKSTACPFNDRVFKYDMRITGAIVEFMSAFVETHDHYYWKSVTV